jgi:4-hydroxy-tetrahydrodipicolinate synthase
MAAGGDGCISVTANVAPRLCADMHGAWRAGRVEAAIALQDSLVPLHDSMFCEASPGPVKYGASLLGFTDAFRRHGRARPVGSVTWPRRKNPR